jgi:hypothetical protein
VAQAIIRFNEITYNIDAILDPKENAFTFLEGLLEPIQDHIKTYLGMNGLFENPTLKDIELAARRAEEIIANKTKPNKVHRVQTKNIMKQPKITQKNTKVPDQPKKLPQKAGAPVCEIVESEEKEPVIMKEPWSTEKIRLYEEHKCFKCFKTGHISRECTTNKIAQVRNPSPKDVDSENETIWFEDRYTDSNSRY